RRVRKQPLTLQRLRKVGSGGTNHSDLAGGLLQRNHVHLAVCAPGAVRAAMDALRTSPKNRPNKVKLLLATDGQAVEAEYLATGEPMACRFVDLADHFGYFLPFAGFTTIQEIKDNPVDVRAT